MKIEGIYVSPESNYWAHGQDFPGGAPTYKLETVRVEKGKGLVGDRHFNRKEDNKGQVTFISKHLLDDMKKDLGLEFDYEDLRRNILVSGQNPLDLVGKKFNIGNVEFLGAEDCAPCAYWSKVIGPGASEWLADHTAGGLRAKVLKGGEISLGQQAEEI